MIARLCGLAVDARAATRTRDVRELAEAARWIAANLLAIRGTCSVLEGEVPAAPLLVVRATELDALLAVLAVVPALADASSLPAHWRLALRTLGVPLLPHPVTGIPAVTLADARGPHLEVAVVGRGYRVRVLGMHHSLAA